MRRLSVLLAFSLCLLGCSSSGTSPGQPGQPAKPEPEILIEQLVGPADMGYPGGRIDIQYQMSVINHAPTSIRLRRLEISSIGGGAYVLRRETLPFDETILPEHQSTVQFWIHAIQAGSFGRGSSEPVTIRGIVYFDSPSGPVHKFFLKELTQFPR